MPATLYVRSDARPDCVRPLRDIAASIASEAGLSSAQVYAVKFCVGEAVANVVKHAYPEGEPGAVEVSAREAGGELAVIVADHGSGRAHQSERSDEGGFGLAFMTRLTDGCTFTATGAGTTVEMRFPLPGGNVRAAPKQHLGAGMWGRAASRTP
jgi:anti-sigma regulatory factor (Ser/Thr protein kinase)